MDLSKLSDADLAQIAKGDMRMVSEEGLRMIAGDTAIQPAQSKTKQTDWRQDFAAGATALPRAIGNLPGKMLGLPWLKSEFDSLGNAADKTSGAYMAGNLADPVAMAIGAGGFNAASKIPMLPTYLKNIVGGAGTGAAIGGLSEEGTAAGGAAIGAGVSAALGPLGYVGGKLWDIGRNISAGALGQASKYLSEIFGDQAARGKIADRVSAMKTGVTGERPTVGLAAVSGDTPIPELKALEEGARSRPAMASTFAKIDASNEAARATPFESIASIGKRTPAETGMPVNLSRAEATRQSITSPLYNAAGKEIISVDDQLLSILGGAEIQPAAKRAGASLDQAIANATAAGKTPPAGYTAPKVTPPPEGTPYWALDPAPKPTTEPATISVNALQRIKNEIDKDISSLTGTTDSSGATKLSQLKTARSQLDTWMRGKSQKWAEAQDTFKELSQFQNQADAANVLLNALQSPAGVERAAAFGNAFRNAQQTISKAGVPRFEELGQVFTPTQMKWANATKQSLDRESQYAALKAPQSTLPEVKNSLDVIREGSPNWLNVVITSFHKVMAKAGGRLDDQSRAIVDGLMVDPAKFSAFLRQATPSERDVIGQYVSSIPSGIPTAGLVASSQPKKNEQPRGLLQINQQPAKRGLLNIQE